MKSKQYMYAAVGAPVAVAKVAQTRVEEFRVKLTEGRESLTKDLHKQLEEWASEGEQFVGKIGESKAIDEITERVDLDQVQEQVSKLRDQLEDLLDTWRANFRPNGKTEKVVEKVEKIAVEVTEAVAEAPKAATAAAKKPAAKTTAAKKPAATKATATKATATKATATKATAAKKPAVQEGSCRGSQGDPELQEVASKEAAMKAATKAPTFGQRPSLEAGRQEARRHQGILRLRSPPEGPSGALAGDQRQQPHQPFLVDTEIKTGNSVEDRHCVGDQSGDQLVAGVGIVPRTHWFARWS
jgi:hypothetical protein